jgi:hypothetical protein
VITHPPFEYEQSHKSGDVGAAVSEDEGDFVGPAVPSGGVVGAFVVGDRVVANEVGASEVGCNAGAVVSVGEGEGAVVGSVVPGGSVAVLGSVVGEALVVAGVCGAAGASDGGGVTEGGGLDPSVAVGWYVDETDCSNDGAEVGLGVGASVFDGAGVVCSSVGVAVGAREVSTEGAELGTSVGSAVEAMKLGARVRQRTWIDWMAERSIVDNEAIAGATHLPYRAEYLSVGLAI